MHLDLAPATNHAQATITPEQPSLEVAVAIAAAGFGKSVTPELAHDVSNHLADGNLVYTLSDPSNPPFGFAIFNHWRHDGSTILYLSGIILDPARQSRGLAGQVIKRAYADARPSNPGPFDQDPVYLALRTSSSLMWRAGQALCDSWSPKPDTAHPATDRLAEIGHHVAGRIDSTFPVHPGCYDGPLYGRPPRHPDEQLQQWWDGLCDYERGDAVICVGRLR